MDAYKTKSFEELHWEDIMKRNNGGAAAPAGSAFGTLASPPKPAFGGTGGFGGFGATTSTGFGAAPTTSAFGSTPATTNAFGAPATTNAFGSPQHQTTNMFGAAPAATSAFGQPATGAFGQPAATTGAFGATTSAFGQAAPAAGGLGSFGGFGKPAAAPAFGAATPATPAFGGFGATSSFGSPTQTQSTGAFGATTGAFGQPAATQNAFKLGGTTTPATTSFGSSFGSPGASTFGSSTLGSFGSMGAAKPATTSFNSSFTLGAQSMQMQPQQQLFGQPQQQAQQQPVVVQTSQPPVTPSVDQKIELLLRKRGDMSAKAKEQAIKTEEVQQSITSPSIILAGLDITRSKQSLRSTPLSSAKLLTRGVRKNTSSDSVSGALASSGTSNGHGDSDQGYNPLSSPIPSSQQFGSAKKLILSTYTTPKTAARDLPPPPSSGKTPLTNYKSVDDRGSLLKNSLMNSQMQMMLPRDNSINSTGLTPNAQHTPIASSARKIKIYNGFPSRADDVPIGLQLPAGLERHEQKRIADAAIQPKLTKEGYHTVPALSELHRMSEDELAEVEDFAVVRPNIGKIEWIGKVDLRGADLDTTVCIEHTVAEVYEGIENVPERGAQLNVPAIVTFEGAWPKGRSKEKLKAFEQKLRKVCDATESTFLSYDPEKGVWSFRVEHFSRYGLIDDSDDENDGAAEEKSSHEATAKTIPVVTASAPVEELLDTPSAVVNTPFTHTKTSTTLKPATTVFSPEDMKSNIQRLRTVLFKDSVSDNSPVPPSSSQSNSQQLTVRNQNRAVTEVAEEEKYDSNNDVFYAESEHRPIRDISRCFEEPPRYPAMLFEEDMRHNAKYRAQFAAAARNHRAFFLPHESPRLQQLLESKQRLLGISSAAPGSTTKTLEMQANVQPQSIPKKDLLLFQGRSFRVGWSGDGRIVHAGQLMQAKQDPQFSHKHRIAVETVSVTQWQERRWAQETSPAISSTVLQLAIDAFVEASDCVPRSESLESAGSNPQRELAPLWRMPFSTDNLDQYNRFARCLKQLRSHLAPLMLPRDHPDWTLRMAVSLLDAAAGQEKLLSPGAVLGDFDYVGVYDEARYDGHSSPELWQRRRAMLTQWFAELTSDMRSTGSHQNVYDETFDLLVSGQQIDAAVACLQRGGKHRLATLVAQLGSDADTQLLMKHQIDLWQVTGALEQHAVPSNVLRLFLLLAAQEHWPQSVRSTSANSCWLRGVGWMRALATLFHFFPGSANNFAADHDATLAQSLAHFQQLLLADEVDAPASPFVHDTGRLGAIVSYPTVQHGLYSLLQLLFPGDQQVNTEQLLTNALRNDGYTRDELDYHTSYVLVTLLEATGHLAQGADIGVAVRQQVLAQLLAANQWRPALFVAAQMAQAGASELLRDLLQRSLAFVSIGQLRDWQQQLHLPAQYLAEAVAIYSGYRGRHVEEFALLCEARLPMQAAEVLCLQLLAHADALKTPGQMLQCLEQIVSLQDQLQQTQQQRWDLSPGQQKMFQVWITLLPALRTFLSISLAAQEARHDNDLQKQPQQQQRLATSLLEEARVALALLTAFHSDDARRRWLQTHFPTFDALLHTAGNYLYTAVSRDEVLQVRQGTLLLAEMQTLRAETLREAPVSRQRCADTIERTTRAFVHAAARSIRL